VAASLRPRIFVLFFFFLSLAPCIVLVIVGLEDFLEENPVRVSARVR
jgi:hypothetical protein